jgi:TolB protein
MTVADGGSTRLWVQATDGGDRRQVSDVSVASAPPAWSPDGQHLVFSSSGLFLVEVASGVVTLVTAEPGSKPAWSMDGTIAFATTGSPSPGVFVVSTDGSSLRRVTGDLPSASRASWAPDGRWLLLSDDDGGSPLAVVKPSRGDVTLLGGNGTGRWPAWQPRLP